MRGTRPSPAARQARLAWGVCLLIIALVLVKIPLLVPLLGGGAVDNPVGEWLFQALSVPFAAVGAVIAARRPANRVGWLLLVGALSLGARSWHGRMFCQLPPTAGRLAGWSAGLATGCP